MYEISIALMFLIVIYFSFNTIYKTLVSAYNEKLKGKFFSTTFFTFSLLFPIMIIVFYNIDGINIKIEYVLFYFLLLIINFALNKFLKVHDIIVYTSLFYSLFIMNYHYEIANDLYFAIFIVIINLIIPLIKIEFQLIEMAIQTDGEYKDIDVKKNIVRQNLKIVNLNDNNTQFSLDDFLESKFNNDEESISVFLDEMIERIYSERINIKLYCYHILMGLLTIYFLLSQI
ncbi:hypothetical protein UFVDC4_00200 [Staphylococcus phage vB_SauM-UFV_DC4]|nr:hypothetical protein UFVDC4_00200 [Staphylococcus phage vB_SauM-UFV_DC4]